MTGRQIKERLVKFFLTHSSLILLLLSVLFILLILELLSPYYFLKDDNITYSLPSFKFNYESIVVDHTLPLINFHQFGGATFFAQGQTATLYPPVYLAVFIAQAIGHNIFLTIDIYVIIHLLAAAMGMFCLLGWLKQKRLVCFLGGLLWVFNPFIIFMSNSWAGIAVYAAFFPLFLLSTSKLAGRNARKDFPFFCLIHLLAFFVGHAQYFVYFLFFELLYLLAYLKINNKLGSIQIWLKYFLALLTTACLSAVLLLPALAVKNESVYRSGKLAFNIYFDHPLILTNFINTQFFNSPEWSFPNNETFYLGLIPLSLLIFGIIKLWRENPLIKYCSLAIIISLLLASNVVLHYLLIYRIPILDSFRWPFKYFFFTEFFFIFTLALILNRWLKLLKVDYLFYLIVFAVIFNNFLYLSINHKVSLSDFIYYTPISSKIVDAITAEGRIFSLNALDKEPIKYLGFNLATLLNKDHLGGYDPIVLKTNSNYGLGANYSCLYRGDFSPELQATLSAKSVRWLIDGGKDQKISEKIKHAPGIKLVSVDRDLALYENTLAEPYIAFLEKNNNAGLHYQFKTNRIIIHPNNPAPGRLKINIAPLKDYQVIIDDQKTNYSIANGPLLIPKNTKEVIIKYVSQELNIGLVITASSFFCLLVIYFLFSPKWLGK